MVLALRSFRFQEEEEKKKKNRIIALIEAQATREFLSFSEREINPDCGKTRWGAEI